MSSHRLARFGQLVARCTPAALIVAAAIALTSACSNQDGASRLSGTLYCSFAGKVSYYDLDASKFVGNAMRMGAGSSLFDSFDVSWDRQKILLFVKPKGSITTNMRRLVVTPMRDGITYDSLASQQNRHDFNLERGDISYTYGHLSADEQFVAIEAQYFKDIPTSLVSLKDQRIVASWQVNGVSLQDYGAPIWTRDNQIFFRIGTDLYRASPKDGYQQAEKLLSFDDGASFVTVNPQGTKIAFRQNRHLWLANIDGSDLRQITTSKTSQVVKYDGERRPTFSPDGKFIAFTSATQRGAPWSDRDYPDKSWVSVVGGEFGYLAIVPADGKRYDLDEQGSGATWLRQSNDSKRGIPCSSSLIWR